MKIFNAPLPAVLACITLMSVNAELRAEQFSFVALGDTTYEVPDDYPLYRSLIDTINAAHPAFSVHIGDTKGWGDCGDEFQLGQKAFFDSFEAPVVYAFGNNEWSDCWTDNRGNHDPLVVLNSMRRIFYPEARAMGKTGMPVLRQSDGEGFPDYAENVRWATEAVTFAAVNVVGGHNNQFLREEKLWREFVDREKANVAWIKSAFASALESGHRAIVISMHSNIFADGNDVEGGPFAAIIDVITTGAQSFAGEVLVVHGHSHEFIVDRPLRVWDDDASTSEHDNISRLQVYGWPDMRAVKVTVDTDTPWVFGFEPLYAVPNISPAFQD